MFDNQFAYITNFNADGLAIAQKYGSEKQYVVNTSGEITNISANSIKVPDNSDEGQPAKLKDMTGIVATSKACNGLIAFVKDGKLGFADSDGNIPVQPTVGIAFHEMYESLNFNEDIIAFETDDDLEYSPIAMINVHRIARPLHQ